MFPKITEIQTLRECSVPGNLYSVDITSWNENVPYGDVFTIYAHHCLVRTVDDHTMFSVYVNIKFRKSVFSVIKSLIEKTSYSGMDEFHDDLALQLSRHFCTPPVRHKRHVRSNWIIATIIYTFADIHIVWFFFTDRSSVQSPLSGSTASIANRASTPPRIETSPTRHKKASSQSQPTPINSHHSQQPTNKFVFPSKSDRTNASPQPSSSRKCACFILVLLVAVSALNVILFVHLVSIRDADVADTSEAWLDALRWDEAANFSSDDWVRIVETRELLHRRKLAAMKRSLVGSISSLKQVYYPTYTHNIHVYHFQTNTSPTQTEYHLLQMVALLATARPQPHFYRSDDDETAATNVGENGQRKLSSSMHSTVVDL